MYFNPNSPEYGQDQIRRGEVWIDMVGNLRDVLWVDARSWDEYRRLHVAGAIAVSEDKYYIQIGSFLSEWRRGRDVVVYCSSQACASAEEIADRLRREAGADKVYVLHGGWETIVKNGTIPLKSGEGR